MHLLLCLSLSLVRLFRSAVAFHCGGLSDPMTEPKEIVAGQIASGFWVHYVAGVTVHPSSDWMVFA